MDFITKCAELKKLTFQSEEWKTLYTSLVKEVYEFDKLYVILNPKKIDYDFEVGIPYITKVKDAVMALLFTDRIHADAWVNKYGNGKNFVGVMDKSMYHDFFAKCVLLRVNVCTVNEGNDSFTFGNADMVNFNNIPTQLKFQIPEELKGKENLTLKDLKVDFYPVPINGKLSSNESIEKLQLVEHMDVEVSALTKDGDILVNDKVHLFLTNAAISNWMMTHKSISSEYVLVKDTVGMFVFNAIKREGSKGVVVDGLAPFSLFAGQDELEKIKSSVSLYSVSTSKKLEKLNGSQAMELLANTEYYVCVDESEDCGYDAMIRENDKDKFKAIQVYATEAAADKFNMKEHEICKVNLNDLIPVAKENNLGFIFEPYSHYWMEIAPQDV